MIMGIGAGESWGWRRRQAFGHQPSPIRHIVVIFMETPLGVPVQRGIQLLAVPLARVRMVTRPVPKDDHIVWSQAREDS